MLLIAASLAFLVIYAGIKLLIQTQQETLDKLYKYVACLFIAAGFFILAGAACLSLVHFCYKGGAMMERRHRIMEGKHEGKGPMMDHTNMEHYRMMMGNMSCSDGREDACDLEECHEKTGSEWHSRKSKCCKEREGNKTMKSEEWKSDSTGRKMYMRNK